MGEQEAAGLSLGQIHDLVLLVNVFASRFAGAINS
jgi:hypothetical protein